VTRARILKKRIKGHITVAITLCAEQPVVQVWVPETKNGVIHRDSLSNARMAMSKRSGGEKPEDIWIAHKELAVAGHPFHKRSNSYWRERGSTSLWEDWVRASITGDWAGQR
jgi:hypothetical protein